MTPPTWPIPISGGGGGAAEAWAGAADAWARQQDGEGAPATADDQATVSWLADYMRNAASPGAAAGSARPTPSSSWLRGITSTC